ncbi:MAG: hypothetical protein ACLFWB_07680 [Armatimonadota bacterium]
MVRTGEWVSEAWALVREDFWLHALIALIFAAVNGTGVGVLIVGPLTCGYYYVILQKLRHPDQRLDINQLRRGFDIFLDSFMGWLVVSVFTGLGSIACLVGSYIVYGLLVFALPLIADREMGFWDAISLSYERAKDHWFGLSVFILVLSLLVGVGSALTCGLGYFALFPIMHVAIVLAYRDNFQTPASEAAAAPNAQW